MIEDLEILLLERTWNSGWIYFRRMREDGLMEFTECI